MLVEARLPEELSGRGINRIDRCGVVAKDGGELRDAFGGEWVFMDKAPIFTGEPVAASSDYPRPGIIACEIIKSWRDDLGREVCTIDTTRPDAVEAEVGKSTFDVLAEQIIGDRAAA